MYLEWNKFLQMSVFLNLDLSNSQNLHKKLKNNNKIHIIETKTRAKAQFYRVTK